MRRKKYLGFFKIKRKTLGKMSLDGIENALINKSTYIHSSSFSKAQKTAQFLCEAYKIDNDKMLNINPNLQDLDFHGCIQLLKNTPNSIDTVVLIAPGTTVSSLFSFLTGKKKIFNSGCAELVKLSIPEWNMLCADSIGIGQLKVPQRSSSPHKMTFTLYE